MVCARRLILSSCVMALFSGLTPLSARPRRAAARTLAAVHWLSSYREAITAADRQNKMLLIYFCDHGADSPCERFKKETLDDPQVRRKLRNYVCLRLPLDAKITVQGKQVVLLEHEAFHEMLGRPGVAIVDYRADAEPARGGGQRVSDHRNALVYAGTDGGDLDSSAGHAHAADADLRGADPSRSSGQHRRRTESDVVGGGRKPFAVSSRHSRARPSLLGLAFRRILSRLPGVGAPREVCAESWGGQNLVEAAIECVRCWRLSSGHWSAVCARSRFFGYDMKCGGNGVWYATGIVDAR